MTNKDITTLCLNSASFLFALFFLYKAQFSAQSFAPYWQQNMGLLKLVLLCFAVVGALRLFLRIKHIRGKK